MTSKCAHCAQANQNIPQGVLRFEHLLPSEFFVARLERHSVLRIHHPQKIEYLEGGRKPTTAIVRKLIKAHLGGGVQVDATSICTITAALTQ